MGSSCATWHDHALHFTHSLNIDLGRVAHVAPREIHVTDPAETRARWKQELSGGTMGPLGKEDAQRVQEFPEMQVITGLRIATLQIIESSPVSSLQT